MIGNKVKVDLGFTTFNGVVHSKCIMDYRNWVIEKEDGSFISVRSSEFN